MLVSLVSVLAQFLEVPASHLNQRVLEQNALIEQTPMPFLLSGDKVYHIISLTIASLSV